MKIAQAPNASQVFLEEPGMHAVWYNARGGMRSGVVTVVRDVRGFVAWLVVGRSKIDRANVICVTRTVEESAVVLLEHQQTLQATRWIR